MVVMVVFVVLNLLHPLCQSLQLLSQAGQLPLLVPHLPVITLLLLPPALLHRDGVVRHHVVVFVTKQHLECKIKLK